MLNYAYDVPREYAPALVCEASPKARRPPASGLEDWTDDELTAIREVLRKLTSLRIQNSADVEDLVQETLLTMAAKCRQIELEKGLLIWGMGILRKKIGNYYRKTKRLTPLLHHPHPRSKRGESRSPLPTPEARLLYAELWSLVETIILTLSPGEKDAVSLYLRGMETSEIADLLRPERYQNVVNRLHRGRRKLARELEKFGFTGSRTA